MNDIKKQIQFHSALNSDIWKNDEMLPEVRLKLLEAALEFYKFLDVKNLLVIDIVVTGSNAAFNYTSYSDIDVHLIADFSSTSCPKLADNLFVTKKALWTNTHDIAIHGHAVELYVEDADKPAISNGIYSILKNKWHKKPKQENPAYDDEAISKKVDIFKKLISETLASKPSQDQVAQLLKKIQELRKNGLAKGGEFSTDNLVFKVLRNLGLIDKLWDYQTKHTDKKLSLEAISESIEVANIAGADVRLFKNPSPSQVFSLTKKFQIIRGIEHDGTIFVWNSYEAVHFQIEAYLGIDKKEGIEFAIQYFPDEDDVAFLTVFSANGMTVSRLRALMVKFPSWTILT